MRRASVIRSSPVVIPSQCLRRRGDATPSTTNTITMLPACAQPCVSSYLQQAFIPSICSNASSFGCLCSHYSNTGYTLGEISLGCLKSGCPNANSSDAVQAYDICKYESGSVAPTHSVLTLLNSVAQATSTQSASSLSAAASTASNAVSSSSTSITISTITSTASTSVSAAAAMTLALTSTSTMTSTSVTLPTSTPAASSQTLSTAEVIGVSVGTVGAVVILAALIFCCACLRRRRQAKRKKERPHSYDFVDNAPPRSPHKQLDKPTSPGPSLLQPLQVPKLSRPPLRPIAPADRYPVSPMSAPNSPNSMSSERTTSQLLPEGPPHSPHVVTQMARVLPRPFSAATRSTHFEEDRTPGFPRGSMRFPVPPSPAYVPYKRGYRPDYASDFTKSPEETQLPKLEIVIPTSVAERPTFVPEGSRRQSTLIARNEVRSPVLRSPIETKDTQLMAQPLSARVSMPPNSAATYLPSYYTSDDSRTPKIPTGSHWSANAPSVPPVPPRRLMTRAARASRASETSFESVDPEEPTPPEEEEQRIRGFQASPITGLRYPKIPRSSNQAIPRSPQLSSPSRSRNEPRPRMQDPSESLIAKRRGYVATCDIEKGFGLGHISDGSSTGHSPTPPSPNLLQRRDPAVQRGQYVPQPPNSNGLVVETWAAPSRPKHGKSIEMSLKSPLWEPRLTPTRKGDALYISVASP